MVEVAGIEPDTPCAETPVTMQDSEFSVEALTEMLTEISGTDRQMLTRIVERWGSLSKDLKQAVLRVVGEGYFQLKSTTNFYFFQVITKEDITLSYVALTVMGDEYDRANITRDFAS